MSQTDLTWRFVEAENEIARASLMVNRQKAALDELLHDGRPAEVAQAKAMLHLLEDALQRRIADRKLILRGIGWSGPEQH